MYIALAVLNAAIASPLIVGLEDARRSVDPEVRGASRS
jgi:hypothetical protein